MSAIKVYVLEQAETDIPSDNNWLSASELLFVDGFRFEKRRADWRLGRWTAKLALASYFSLPIEIESLAKIEIRPARSGAPEAFIGGRPAAATVSLSHRAGRSMCAVAEPGAKLGCDLEAVEAHTATFVADYFTRAEQNLIARADAHEQSLVTALLWSAKESALKALHEGLRLDTREVVVRPEGDFVARPAWQRLEVHQENTQTFDGWWRCEAELVRTVVAEPAPVPPVDLPVVMIVSSSQST